MLRQKWPQVHGRSGGTSGACVMTVVVQYHGNSTAVSWQ